ncbi:MAG: beta-eliminating lyase-related protein [Paracoccaceae bacterium]|nr:beta-eliminating lyase-related protein [Paracoccaceae bacterium]
MHFASDNGGPVPPQVLEALTRANDGYAWAYGADPVSQEVVAGVRALFEAPEAAVHLAATGTAANALALACLCPPFATVFCSPVAHIHEDECNAPEFYTGGAKLTLVPGADKMTPEALRASIQAEETRGVHGPQRGAVSLTTVTERGSVYALDELRALCDVAKEFDLPVHLDGARFANACVALGCKPAEMTWKLGVDVAVFGGTKNGLMGAEAVVFFDPAKSWEFELRRKRGGHLFSKHRYMAAQMQAYLAGDLWRDLATRANAACARLATGLRTAGIRIASGAEANMIYFEATAAQHRTLKAAGALYHASGDLEAAAPDALLLGRLVCDWSQSEASIDRFVDTLKAV